MLGHCLLNALVNWEESLAGSPVHLADELATESVDDTGNGWGSALADEIEIQHALDGSWLETIDKASGLVVEESTISVWAQRSAWSSETADVVVGISGRGWGKPGSVCGGRSHYKGILKGLKNASTISRCSILLFERCLNSE